MNLWILNGIALIYGEALHGAEPRFEPRADFAAAGRAIKNLVPEKGWLRACSFLNSEKLNFFHFSVLKGQ